MSTFGALCTGIVVLVLLLAASEGQQHRPYDPYPEFVKFVSGSEPEFRMYSSTNRQESSPKDNHQYERSGGHRYGGQRSLNRAFGGAYGNRGGHNHGDPYPGTGSGYDRQASSYGAQPQESFQSGYGSPTSRGYGEHGGGHAAAGGYGRHSYGAYDGN